MKRWSRRSVLSGLGAFAVLHQGAGTEATQPIIDTHVHPPRRMGGDDSGFRPEMALATMNEYGIERAILSPPPYPADIRGIDAPDLRALTRGNPRFAFAAGGESLNPMLQLTPAARVSADVLRRFTAQAEQIAATGAASFGEMAAEHFSSGRGRHPYESSPPDHPLLLALADVAARESMPIDVHMEAVPENMPFPANRPRGPNPARLSANIERFERLLEHNPAARIVWLHAGWDLTGARSVGLMRDLLTRHPNLSMSIKCDRSGWRPTAPFLPDSDVLRPAWLELLAAFPDRFMIGSDQFVGEDSERSERVRRLVDALPAELKLPIGVANAQRVYRLPAA